MKFIPLRADFLSTVHVFPIAQKSLHHPAALTASAIHLNSTTPLLLLLLYYNNAILLVMYVVQYVYSNIQWTQLIYPLNGNRHS